jgi:ribosomal protein eS8
LNRPPVDSFSSRHDFNLKFLIKHSLKRRPLDRFDKPKLRLNQPKEKTSVAFSFLKQPWVRAHFVRESAQLTTRVGISRDSRHKRSATGAKRAHFRKKRKFELGRQAAMTKLGPKRIHSVRVRGGHLKFRALRLEAGNFSWGSEAISRKTRVIDVVYNSTNNELVRTKTLVKNAIVQIDATPFRQWYEAHYGQALGKKGNKKATPAAVRSVYGFAVLTFCA